VLVDVREMWEWDIGNLEARGAVHIPLAELLDRADELPEGRPVVAYCRVGNRSLDAAERLQSAGYAAKSLRGGLTDWKQKIDPSVTVA
jgi:rhodanese-related sulfurtransferase